MAMLTGDEIIALINRINVVKNHTEAETDELLMKLKSGTADPHISDYIFFEGLSPEEAADKALAYKPILL